jgi:hypothetical protein
MFKKTLLNLAMLIVFAALAAVIYLSDEQGHELQKLTDINVDGINSIRIQHNNNHTNIIRQGDEQWHITQPVDIAANNFRINTILDLLNAPVHNQYPITEVDTTVTGLSASQTIVQFNDLKITFGIINPVTNLRYVSLNDQVYTIEDVYYPLLTSDYSALVSLNLLPADSTIEKIVLPQQTIYRDKNGQWRSTRDSNADSLTDIIQHWRHDQAFGVHRFMPRKQLGDVTVFLAGVTKPIKFTISDTDPWVILGRPDIDLEYHLEKEKQEGLLGQSEN